ncbi:hypothetical protein [Stenotrophomonas sp. BIGb0135]|uniref:hypothetical protein n=1 Tax=Stenotrophomonas sp. BIGb0135 TaxID=2940620 RepID=UPI0021690CAE|nr:hypothetical protein [Stenotrophomonas sp. BIGb0135]MCS4234801.1 hypothetical protein [Stenotrophomonas sp. BIGb0135]
MNIEFLRAALASGLFACAGFAHAAPAAVNQQWEVTSVRVGFHSSVSSCIFSAIGATNAWNAVGADLYLPTDSLATHPRVSEQTQAFNYANITVEDADNVTPGAGMETRTTVNPNTGTISTPTSTSTASAWIRRPASPSSSARRRPPFQRIGSTESPRSCTNSGMQWDSTTATIPTARCTRPCRRAR